jgi:hypothetical protein
MRQDGRSRIRISMSLDFFSFPFFSFPKPFSRTMALGLTQPLTEMSTSILSGGKARPGRKADNLTAILVDGRNGAFGGSAQRKPAPLLLCRSQTPQERT